MFQLSCIRRALRMASPTRTRRDLWELSDSESCNIGGPRIQRDWLEDCCMARGCDFWKTTFPISSQINYLGVNSLEVPDFGQKIREPIRNVGNRNFYNSIDVDQNRALPQMLPCWTVTRTSFGELVEINSLWWVLLGPPTMSSQSTIYYSRILHRYAIS